MSIVSVDIVNRRQTQLQFSRLTLWFIYAWMEAFTVAVNNILQAMRFRVFKAHMIWYEGSKICCYGEPFFGRITLGITNEKNKIRFKQEVWNNLLEILNASNQYSDEAMLMVGNIQELCLWDFHQGSIDTLWTLSFNPSMLKESWKV